MSKWIFVSLVLGGLIQLGCSAFRPIADQPAERTSSSKEQNLRNKLFHFAKTTIGSPYRYGGTDRNGFDCSGLTFYIYQNHGISIPRTSGTQFSKGVKIKQEKAQKGDLAFFALGGKIDHVGIIAKSNRKELWIIHSTTSKGVIYQDVLASPYWTQRFVGVKDIVSDM